MAMATLIRKPFNCGGELAYSVRGSVHYHHDGEHGSIRADTVLELRLLHLAGNRKSIDTVSGILSSGSLKALPTVTHYLQQGHTHDNKDTPPNSATLFGGHFLSNHHILLCGPQKLIAT